MVARGSTGLYARFPKWQCNLCGISSELNIKRVVF